jgi:hypothetical protein
VHLLGGDEVGTAPGDVGLGPFTRRRAGEVPAAAVELGDAQGGAAHGGDAGGHGVGAGVEHRPFHGQLAGLAADQPGHEQAAGEGECADDAGLVGGVGGDATGALAHALAAGALLGRQAVVVERAEQLVRVGHQAFLAGGDGAPTGSSPGRRRRGCGRTRPAVRPSRRRGRAGRRE